MTQSANKLPDDVVGLKEIIAEQILSINKFEESINEETFNQMIERHQNMEEHRQIMQEARESGDYSKIEQLREESGFQGMGGRGKGNFEGGCPLMGY